MILTKVLCRGAKGDGDFNLGAASRKVTCLQLSGISVLFDGCLVITQKESESLKVNVTHQSGKEDAARGLRDPCGGEGCIHRSTRCYPAYRSTVASSVLAELA